MGYQCRISMEISRVDVVKVVGIPGGISKFDGKTGISRGVNAKSRKFQGGHHRSVWKSRGSTSTRLKICTSLHKIETYQRQARDP